MCWIESVFSTENWRSPGTNESLVITKYFRQSLSPRSCLSFHLHYSTRETRWHSFHPHVGATPAAWQIAADYRPDTFIWSVSAVILSSLTPAANNSALSPLAALAGGLWGRPGRQRWNVLRWNLKPFVCCCLHLECGREWAVERLSLGLRGADVRASPRFWGENMHAPTYTPLLYPQVITAPPLLQAQTGLRAFIVRAHRPRGPNAPHSGSFFTPTRHRRYSHANMISICYFSAGAVYGPDATACLPFWLSRPCQGRYLQVKTCRLHSVSLCAHERGEKGVSRGEK